MRVYHFLSSKYGLENIKKRRLKIATIPDLNDPFELLSSDLSNESIRNAFINLKAKLAQDKGLLCFSKNWTNPVQWGHYADRHRGLCLGFDVPDENLTPVSYSARRTLKDLESKLGEGLLDNDMTLSILSTKYSHWKYENEVRCFVQLDTKDRIRNLYFAPFSEKLALKQVIIGALSTTTKSEILKALGSHKHPIEIIQTRLAFQSFRVVKDLRKN